MTINDDELDLRPFITNILNKWKLIVGIAFLAALVAFTLSMFTPRSFESTSTILLTRRRATLSLASQFPTINEPIDNRSRMDAMLTIASSDAIAKATLDAFIDHLEPDGRELENFKDKVEVVNQGDAIQISASARTPDLAAAIANTWSKEATLAINIAYGAEQPLTVIQAELVARKADFENSQARLEEFIEDNEIEVLTQQIEEAKTLFSKLTGDRALKIDYFATRKFDMDLLINQIEALIRQMKAGNASEAGDLGDALTVLMARSNALGLTSELAIDLRLEDINSLRDSQANYVADLEGLLEEATEESAIAESTLESLATEVFQKPSDNQFVEQVATQIRELETRLERENANELELRSTRDLDWQAYQALAQKEVEITSSDQAEVQVTLASQAIPPNKPASRGTVLRTIGAGVLGFVLAVFWVVITQWWSSFNRSGPDHLGEANRSPANK